MHPTRVVFGKEIRDGRRDLRAIFSALLFPVLGPILVYGMMTIVIQLRSQAEETVIPVQGAQHAPALIQWLREHQVRIEAFDGDAREAVKSRDKQLVLIIPEDYQTRYAEGRRALVEIITDGSRTDARVTVGRLNGLIRTFSAELAGLRLVVRGISPEIMEVVRVEEIDVASEQQRAASALNFIPMYIILAAFVSGMGIAVDSTAGERERKTLEPLLINPIERLQIVSGKWLAATVFAGFGMVLTTILCMLAMTQVPLADVGLALRVTPVQVLTMIIATLPLPFLATSLQLLLGIFARSFKDAQSYIGLLILLPIAPSLFTLLNPVATQDWMYAVPLLGQQILLVDAIGGKPIPLIAYVFSMLSCLLIGLGVVTVTARLFQRESIIKG